MSATATENLADRRPVSFEEFRDAWEAEDPQKGLAKLLQRMILRLLNALVVLLAEARAEDAGVVRDAEDRQANDQASLVPDDNGSIAEDVSDAGRCSGRAFRVGKDSTPTPPSPASAGEGREVHRRADGAVAPPPPRPTGSSPVAKPHSPIEGEGEEAVTLALPALRTWGTERNDGRTAPAVSKGLRAVETDVMPGECVVRRPPLTLPLRGPLPQGERDSMRASIQKWVWTQTHYCVHTVTRS
jgi:hypothetical protein